jgi:hypothetical protein
VTAHIHATEEIMGEQQTPPVFGYGEPTEHPDALRLSDIHAGLWVIVHRRNGPAQELHKILTEPDAAMCVDTFNASTGEQQRLYLANMGVVPYQGHPTDRHGREFWNHANHTTRSPAQPGE